MSRGQDVSNLLTVLHVYSTRVHVINANQVTRVPSAAVSVSRTPGLVERHTSCKAAHNLKDKSLEGLGWCVARVLTLFLSRGGTRCTANVHPRVVPALLVTLLWSTSWAPDQAWPSGHPRLERIGLRYALATLCLLPQTACGISRMASAGTWPRPIALDRSIHPGRAVLEPRSSAVTVSLMLSFTTILVAWLVSFFLGTPHLPCSGRGLACTGLVCAYFYPLSELRGKACGLCCLWHRSAGQRAVLDPWEVRQSPARNWTRWLSPRLAWALCAAHLLPVYP